MRKKVEIRKYSVWRMDVAMRNTEKKRQTVKVVGGGLAGCEAAWQLAEQGIDVLLYEMKPVNFSPAHHSEKLAELVCSNSLKAERIENACGLLKAESLAFWLSDDAGSGQSASSGRRRPGC